MPWPPIAAAIEDSRAGALTHAPTKREGEAVLVAPHELEDALERSVVKEKRRHGRDVPRRLQNIKSTRESRRRVELRDRRLKAARCAGRVLDPGRSRWRERQGGHAFHLPSLPEDRHASVEVDFSEGIENPLADQPFEAGPRHNVRGSPSRRVRPSGRTPCRGSRRPSSSCAWASACHAVSTRARVPGERSAQRIFGSGWLISSQ